MPITGAGDPYAGSLVQNQYVESLTYDGWMTFVLNAVVVVRCLKQVVQDMTITSHAEYVLSFGDATTAPRGFSCSRAWVDTAAHMLHYNVSDPEASGPGICASAISAAARGAKNFNSTTPRTDCTGSAAIPSDLWIPYTRFGPGEITDIPDGGGAEVLSGSIFVALSPYMGVKLCPYSVTPVTVDGVSAYTIAGGTSFPSTFTVACMTVARVGASLVVTYPTFTRDPYLSVTCPDSFSHNVSFTGIYALWPSPTVTPSGTLTASATPVTATPSAVPSTSATPSVSASPTLSASPLPPSATASATANATASATNPASGGGGIAGGSQGPPAPSWGQVSPSAAPGNASAGDSGSAGGPGPVNGGLIGGVVAVVLLLLSLGGLWGYFYGRSARRRHQAHTRSLKRVAAAQRIMAAEAAGAAASSSAVIDALSLLAGDGAADLLGGPAGPGGGAAAGDGGGDAGARLRPKRKSSSFSPVLSARSSLVGAGAAGGSRLSGAAAPEQQQQRDRVRAAVALSICSELQALATEGGAADFETASALDAAGGGAGSGAPASPVSRGAASPAPRSAPISRQGSLLDVARRDVAKGIVAAFPPAALQASALAGMRAATHALGDLPRLLAAVQASGEEPAAARSGAASPAASGTRTSRTSYSTAREASLDDEEAACRPASRVHRVLVDAAVTAVLHCIHDEMGGPQGPRAPPVLPPPAGGADEGPGPEGGEGTDASLVRLHPEVRRSLAALGPASTAFLRSYYRQAAEGELKVPAQHAVPLAATTTAAAEGVGAQPGAAEGAKRGWTEAVKALAVARLQDRVAAAQRVAAAPRTPPRRPPLPQTLEPTQVAADEGAERSRPASVRPPSECLPIDWALDGEEAGDEGTASLGARRSAPRFPLAAHGAGPGAGGTVQRVTFATSEHRRHADKSAAGGPRPLQPALERASSAHELRQTRRTLEALVVLSLDLGARKASAMLFDRLTPEDAAVAERLEAAQRTGARAAEAGAGAGSPALSIRSAVTIAATGGAAAELPLSGAAAQPPSGGADASTVPGDAAAAVAASALAADVDDGGSSWESYTASSDGGEGGSSDRERSPAPAAGSGLELVPLPACALVLDAAAAAASGASPTAAAAEDIATSTVARRQLQDRDDASNAPGQRGSRRVMQGPQTVRSKRAGARGTSAPVKAPASGSVVPAPTPSPRKGARSAAASSESWGEGDDELVGLTGNPLHAAFNSSPRSAPASAAAHGSGRRFVSANPALADRGPAAASAEKQAKQRRRRRRADRPVNRPGSRGARAQALAAALPDSLAGIDSLLAQQLAAFQAVTADLEVRGREHALTDAARTVLRFLCCGRMPGGAADSRRGRSGRSAASAEGEVIMANPLKLAALAGRQHSGKGKGGSPRSLGVDGKDGGSARRTMVPRGAKLGEPFVAAQVSPLLHYLSQKALPAEARSSVFPSRPPSLRLPGQAGEGSRRRVQPVPESVGPAGSSLRAHRATSAGSGFRNPLQRLFMFSAEPDVGGPAMAGAKPTGTGRITVDARGQSERRSSHHMTTSPLLHIMAQRQQQQLLQPQNA